jgi:hypothetical protein
MGFWNDKCIRFPEEQDSEMTCMRLPDEHESEKTNSYASQMNRTKHMEARRPTTFPLPSLPPRIRQYRRIFIFVQRSSSLYQSGLVKLKNKQQTPCPQANYTDWSTATGRRILVPTFMDRGVSRSQRDGTPTDVNLSFLDWSCYFFFQVTLHLSFQVLSGPRSTLIATQKIW